MTVQTKRQITSAVGSSVTAAQDLVAEMERDGFAVLPGFVPREGHIYVRTRAISARINQNYDGFPSEELRKAYATFLGKPVFVNHANSDVKRARGRVVAAAYLERGDDKFVDTFMEVNAQKFPRLAHEIKTGGIDAVSMGCEAQRTVCSYCGNEASGLHDMCEHVLYHKGQQLPLSDQITGAVEDRLVYESCYDLGFFELSFVFDPADETALASKVLVASRRTPNRIYCDLPGCRRWTNIGGENSQDWVQRNGEGRTYDYCCNGHKEQYERQYPNWLKDSAIRNPVKKRAFGETEAPSSSYSQVHESQAAGHEVPVVESEVQSGHLSRVSEGSARGGASASGVVPELLPERQSARGSRRGSSASEAPAGSTATEQSSGGVQADRSERVRGAENRQRTRESRSEQLGLGAPARHGADARAQAATRRAGTPQERRQGGQQTGELGAVVQTSADGRSNRGPDRVSGGAPQGLRGGRTEKVGFGEVTAPPSVDTLRDEGQDGDEFHRYVEPPPELDDPDLNKAQELDRREDEPGAIGNDDIPSEDMDMAPRQTAPAPRRDNSGATQRHADYNGWEPSGESGMWNKWYNDDVVGTIEQNPDGFAWLVTDENDDEIASGVGQTLEEAISQADPAARGRTSARKDTDMGKPSLADRGRVATRDRRRHADQSRNDQGEQEEVFVTQTPPAEPVETADGEEISNTEQNLVAKARAGRAAEARLRRLRARRAAGAGRRKQAEETADVVNPEQSGTDADLKGDFESADPNDGVQETQPKDAKVRRAFRSWVVETQGTTVTAAKNRGALLRWAGTFARENGLDVKAMYPIVRAEAEALVARRKRAADNDGVSGGQADKDAVEEFIKDPGDADNTKESSRRKRASDDEGDKPDFLKDDEDSGDDSDKKESKRKTADEKLDVAAPDGRIDVERPTQNTTDDEAQASQFDKGDFGDNAGDDLADPDLSTDQNWAPGEGKRSHRVVKKAGGIQAMRLAEAYVTAGLDDKNKGRYTLAAEFEQMSAGTVADRIQLLEKVIQANALGQRQERRTAGVRGGGVKSAVPQNFTARQQAASPQQRQSAAGEIGNPDSDLFFS